MTFHWTTFVFQVVNFVVLVAILWRVLWTPLRRHMQDRADRIAAGLFEANTGQVEIARLKVETLQLREEARLAKADAMRQAEIEVNARRVEMLESARRAASDERDRMLAQAANEQQRLEQEFLHSLTPLIGRILERLLLEMRGLKLHDLASERFADWLDAIPLDERARLSSAVAEGRQVDLASASGEVPSRLQVALRSLLMTDGPLAVHSDEQLIAGVRLRVGESVIDGSLRAQIDRAMQQVSSGDLG